MLVGWLVGLVIGTITQRTIDDHIAAFKQQNPIPGEEVSAGSGVDSAVGKAA